MANSEDTRPREQNGAAFYIARQPLAAVALTDSRLRTAETIPVSRKAGRLSGG